MTARPAIGLVALLGAALWSGFLLLRTREDAPEPAPAQKLGVGYYANEARLTGTDDEGRVVFRIAAANITQAPADGSVKLREVRIDYDPATDAPWRLTAAAGALAPGGKMVELAGDVVAQSRDDDGPAATIRTDFLRFDPSTRVATTDRKVLIDYAGSTVNAIGLRAHLREDRLELLSSVEGRYVR